jgi:para-nitrobenzyl esterase
VPPADVSHRQTTADLSGLPPAPVVTTSRGAVRGAALASGVCAYLGMPYAAPPVGARRFLPPVPAERWGGVRPAVAHGPAPIQAAPAPGRVLLDLSVPQQSEDCLHLAVWTPAPDRTARLPVMVWLYGGAFVTGANSVPAYDGARLAARGVVVVSVNYRLGLFGWLRHRALGAAGNQGLDDQLAALEWVQEEIAGFGGDPDNVTAFGESAGAGSIAAHLAAAADGRPVPLRRAVLQSGSYNLIGSAEEAADTVERLTAQLGVPPAQWRDLPTEVLRAAQDEATPRAAGVFYRPVADGRRLPLDPATALAGSGKLAAGVPVLCGTNADEFGFFWGRIARFDSMTDEQLAELAQRWHADPAGLVERYRSARAARGEATDARSLGMAMAGDATFRAAVLAFAEWQSRRADAFTYRFERPCPLHGGLIGACHVLEVPFVLGTFDHPTVSAFTGFDRAPEAVTSLSDEMAASWVRFATSGDPGWPRFEARHRTTRIFGGSAFTIDDPSGPEREAWDPLRLPPR